MSLHSLLLIGTSISPIVLKHKLNTIFDPDRLLDKLGGCILEIFELQQGAYLVVINNITLLLISLYENLYMDDARIMLNTELYTVSIADKTKHMYLLPSPWKTKGPYIKNSIIYKNRSHLTYTCEFKEDMFLI